MQTASKTSRTWVHHLSSEKQSSHYASLPAAFNPLPPSMDQEVFEKQLCNQSSQYEKYICYKEETTELTLFTVRKDEWNIKEGTGKSMKNALYRLWYTSRAEATSNTEKN